MNSDYPSTKPQLTAADFHGNDTQTMNSLQIAELVQSRHDSVKRTIERLVEQEIIACPPMVDVQENKGNSRNYTTQAYFFSGEQGKLDSITVAAQLCPPFYRRHRQTLAGTRTAQQPRQQRRTRCPARGKPPPVLAGGRIAGRIHQDAWRRPETAALPPPRSQQPRMRATARLLRAQHWPPPCPPQTARLR